MHDLKRCLQCGSAGLILGTAALLGGCATQQMAEQPVAGLANPAAQYCESVGGRTVVISRSGGMQGYCILPDGERVDQWEFYRLNHPDS